MRTPAIVSGEGHWTGQTPATDGTVKFYGTPVSIVNGNDGAIRSLVNEANAAQELALSLGRVDAVAKRGKDGRVFIDYRDWEALMAQQRATLATLAKAKGF